MDASPLTRTKALCSERGHTVPQAPLARLQPDGHSAQRDGAAAAASPARRARLPLPARPAATGAAVLRGRPQEAAGCGGGGQGAGAAQEAGGGKERWLGTGSTRRRVSLRAHACALYGQTPLPPSCSPARSDVPLPPAPPLQRRRCRSSWNTAAAAGQRAEVCHTRFTASPTMQRHHLSPCTCARTHSRAAPPPPWPWWLHTLPYSPQPRWTRTHRARGRGRRAARGRRDVPRRAGPWPPLQHVRRLRQRGRAAGGSTRARAAVWASEGRAFPAGGPDTAAAAAAAATSCRGASRCPAAGTGVAAGRPREGAVGRRCGRQLTSPQGWGRVPRWGRLCSQGSRSRS